MSQGTDELASVKADVFHLKEQVGPDSQKLQHVFIALSQWATQINNLIGWVKAICKGQRDATITLTQIYSQTKRKKYHPEFLQKCLQEDLQKLQGK